jgi:BON domain
VGRDCAGRQGSLPKNSREELTEPPGIFFALLNDEMIWQEVFMDRAIFLVVMLALSAAVAFFACGRSEEPTTSPANAAPVAPGAGSPASANNSLEKAVKAKFDSDEQLKIANISVDADVTKNEVTLSGTVDSEAIRAKAVELAKSAQVGVVINDKINVKGRQSNTMPPMSPQATALV